MALDIRLLDLEDVAEMFGMSVLTARRRVLDGIWPHTRIKNKIQFTEDNVAEIVRLSNRPAKPTTPARTARPRRAS